MTRTGRKPRLNHVAISVPAERLGSEGRAELLRFYQEVLGWDEMPTLSEDGKRLVLRLYKNTQFLFLVSDQDPMRCPSLDHFGIQVDGLAELHEILEAAKKYKERDERVEIIDHHVDEYPGVRLHNCYLRYLLPMMVEIQCYEWSPAASG